MKSPLKRPELLAPAGSLEAFEAAVAAGADAVYVGAPGANARALARDFSPEELAAMIEFAHARQVRVYAAMNSLIKEDELPAAARTLQLLVGLGIDALIIQDLGLYALARRHFPQLRLHASTLMGAHNPPAVQQLAQMDFARVVLARELSLPEISEIHRHSPVELEVFVHGAMCFSYSGLCLFSSYLGGKSSMRGRCVQPCRRRYQWGGGPEKVSKHRGQEVSDHVGRRGRLPEQGGATATEPGGYLFSMNDLEALELLPELIAAGVASFKIEGRMRSAQYVGQVVRAYRLVLDAWAGMGPEMNKSAPVFAAALAEGRTLLQEAMGRRAGPGFFPAGEGRPPGELIAPQHSGNTGLFLGKIESCRGKLARLALRQPVRNGDRLRLHLEASGERQPFTLKGLGHGQGQAAAGERVEIVLPGPARPGDSLYKVDAAERRQGAAARRQLVVGEGHRRRVAALIRASQGKAGEFAYLVARPAGAPGKASAPRKPLPGPGRRGRSGQPVAELPIRVRLDDPLLLRGPWPSGVEALIVPLSPEQWPGFAKALAVKPRLPGRLIWALPPVIIAPDLPWYQARIKELRGRGFAAWQIGHLGQVALFDAAEDEAAATGSSRPAPRKGLRSPALTLEGDYTLNIMNHLALETCRRLGLVSVQAAVESDREMLALLGRRLPGAFGLTIYGRPPLFTARAAPDFFRWQTPFVSPRGESFVLVREFGQTLALAAQPFSLLAHTQELAAMGVAYGVIDLRRLRLKKNDLAGLLRQAGKPLRGRPPLSSFNYRAGLA